MLDVIHNFDKISDDGNAMWSAVPNCASSILKYPW